MVEIISVQDYFELNDNTPVIDVRSPAEFQKGHWPGACNIPLFTNSERAEVGTVYKKKSKEKAIELGYKFVTPKLDSFIGDAQKAAPSGAVTVHCWRGGMRSQAFANHLHNNGFDKVYIIENGYKAFRNYVLSFFENRFTLKILGGYTGSGKTDILKQLSANNHQVIDLEGLANHKGSAFGAIGEMPQPTVEHFENMLFFKMKVLNHKKPIWVEDESLNIGKVIIPKAFFNQMREQVVYFLDIPVMQRAKYLVSTYGQYDKQALRDSVERIRKRLGHKKTQEAIDALGDNNLQKVAEITLGYYDRAYLKGVENRKYEKVVKIQLANVDTIENMDLLLNEAE